MKDCVFCKIVKGDIPSYQVWEDDNHLAFLTIFPNTDGFTVVTTKAHMPSNFTEAPKEEVLSLVEASRQVANKIETAYADDVQRCAMVFEGYGVDHLHTKLIPLHGTANKQWREFNMHSDKYFDKYEGYISTHEPSDMADKEKLEAIAKKIKNA